MTTVDCVLDAKAKVGEAAVWEERQQALWWADIDGNALHRFDPATGTDRSWDVGTKLGCFALRERGGFVLALQTGFTFFDTDTGAMDFIVNPEPDTPTNRLNDGTTDPHGRFVAGTMPMGPREPVANVHRLWADGRCELLWGDMIVSNGMAFSPDGKTFYWSDSDPRRRSIWACAYDPDTGALGERRLFFDTHGRPGRPDGGTVDADGCYWMAGVSGWELVRITPAGEVDRVIEMPVEKPTKIAFGGRELDTLYVTSIGPDGCTPGTLERQPHAGGLFALQVPGVRGVPAWYFAG